jgi:hypothetical protein
MVKQLFLFDLPKPGIILSAPLFLSFGLTLPNFFTLAKIVGLSGPAKFF